MPNKKRDSRKAFDQRAFGGREVRRVVLAGCLALVALTPRVEAQIFSEPTDTSGLDQTATADSIEAYRDMEIGRFYLNKGNRISAVNRFKLVITQHKTSPYVAEALSHLAEILLSVDNPLEAQAAAALLDRNYPSNMWSIRTRNLLQWRNLAALGDEKSWIWRALR